MECEAITDDWLLGWEESRLDYGPAVIECAFDSLAKAEEMRAWLRLSLQNSAWPPIILSEGVRLLSAGGELSDEELLLKVSRS